MPVLTILAHGATVGVAPPTNNSSVPSGKSTGWSSDSTRRNTAFLRSIHHSELSGNGFAATLTLRNCPESPCEWARARNNFFQRLNRMGLVRLHWVTEWQKRRVPHLHVAVWLKNPENSGPEILAHWIEATKQYRPALKSQTVLPITHFGGWAQYVAKHSARGAAHYQRSIHARPAGWASSGRVWGKRGQWPVITPTKLEMPHSAFYALRRAMRSWRIADARKSGNPRRISQARSMLTCHNRNLSEVRGCSEWIPDQVMITLVESLSRSGHVFLDSPTRKQRISARLNEVGVAREDFFRAAEPTEDASKGIKTGVILG